MSREVTLQIDWEELDKPVWMIEGKSDFGTYHVFRGGEVPYLAVFYGQDETEIGLGDATTAYSAMSLAYRHHIGLIWADPSLVVVPSKQTQEALPNWRDAQDLIV